MTAIKTDSSTQNYIGRFAPSPSGPLHFGSLVAALASYLQARHHQGKWLVRIEDIDPPREMPGAANLILDSLNAHGLHWDQAVTKQSDNGQRYEVQLRRLQRANLTYRCDCTRKKIKAAGGYYNGYCRNRHLPALTNTAIRFVNQAPVASFQDGLLGQIRGHSEFAREDFVLKRRDGLYAYHLAVVADDISQNISEIVRGADLLETSCCHLALYDALGIKPPNYIHVPVASTAVGKKLSKQNHAPALDNSRAHENLHRALDFLGQNPPKSIKNNSVENILSWAIEYWQLAKVPKKREIVLTSFS